MALKTFVKINSVNNLSDARYCAGMNVDLLGFNLDVSSENHVNHENFKAITGWTSGVQFVGEFADSNLKSMNTSINEYEIDYVESNNLQMLNLLATDKKKILNTSIEALNADNWQGIDYIIVSSTKEFTDAEMDKIREHSTKHQILLGSGITAGNIERVLKATEAYGIALTAGDEIRPGYKDYDELADILEALEVDEWV